MSASAYEYKTVALPQTVEGKRRRGQSEADQVAIALGETIHAEATDGWEYMRSDVLAARGRASMFSKEAPVNTYTVLVFRRAMESVWPVTKEAGREAAAPVAQPAPPREEPPLPMMIADPTSPLANGTTLTSGGQFRADSTRGTVPVNPRPPLGSAQD